MNEDKLKQLIQTQQQGVYMSNKLNDDIQDYLIDHEHELLMQYLESDNHWKDFTGWLFSEKQNNLLDRLFSEFLTKQSKERERFDSWAIQKVSEMLSHGE